MEDTEAMTAQSSGGDAVFSFRPQRQKWDQQKSPLSGQDAFRWHSKKMRRENGRSHGGHMRHEGKTYPLLEYTDHARAHHEVQQHFNKQFSFTPRTDTSHNIVWKLPPPESMYTAPLWKVKRLQEMKSSLNDTKRQLSDKDIVTWASHTNNTNPVQKIAYAVRRQAQPEMVTQAWLKFYEVVNEYPIVPLDAEEDEMLQSEMEDQKPFNSVHLCEAPGAFILALNHYLALNRPHTKWQWLGNTLNPYYEGSSPDYCVTEDRFIFLTLNQWLFGRDNTGDLMTKENLDQIVDRSKRLGPIHLVTADGSFDCQANPGEQEITTHGLHFCEVVSALSMLTSGGSVVVKKFTFFESQSLCLMFLLCCVFQEVHVYKPGTSKQGNSEVYVVGLGYVGKEALKDHLERLLDVYGRDATCSMFAQEDIPEEFLRQIEECADTFKKYQEDSINRNISLFRNMYERANQYNELVKTKAVEMFFERNFCSAIPKWKMVTEGLVNETRQNIGSCSKTDNALIVRNTTAKEKFKILIKFLQEAITAHSSSEDESSLEEIPSVSFCFDSGKLEDIEFEVIHGKPFQHLNSSKLASGRVLRVFRELHCLWQNTEASKNTLNIDDGLAQQLAKTIKGAVILQEKNTDGPISGCQVLEEVALLLEKGKVSPGGSLVLVNVPLLSRLQCGLLKVLSCAFSHVRAHVPSAAGKQAPVIVLERLRAVGVGEAVVRSLRRAGWEPDGGRGGVGGLLQVVSYPSLLQKSHQLTLSEYNVHFCIHQATLIWHCTEAVFQ